MGPIDDRQAPEMIIPSELPTPESSLRPGFSDGSKVPLADGREWTLVDFVPARTEVWDRIYDGNVVVSRYEAADVRLAAFRLLAAAHDLPADYAAWLIGGADADALARAVETALFGHRDELRTWADWVDSSLRANLIDPATVPPHRLRPLLDALVMAGRAPNHSDYTSAGRASAKRTKLGEMFERSANPPGRGEVTP